MSKLNIDVTETFIKNYEFLFNSDKRFGINQGGSRSGKTWGLCQLMILYAITKPNTEIAIFRKSLNSVRNTVMKDFFKVMKDLQLYNVKQHNKTENKYTFKNGSVINFLGADEEQKLRGISATIAWLNEGNELWNEDFFQINLRTTTKLIVDFNPSDADVWIYDLPEEDKILIKSTYKDNPFLGQAQVKEIEQLIETDENLYKIYALGERATTRQNVFQQWNWVDEFDKARFDDYVIGVDFGFVHKTAVVKVWFNDLNEIYIEPILYEDGLTGLQIAQKLDGLALSKTNDMVCDFARPEIMEELRNYDFNVFDANKNVNAGLDCVRSFKVFANNKDEDLKKEYQNYMHRKIKGKLTQDVVKQWDDYMDAIRYACMRIKKYYLNNTGMSSFQG